MLPSNRSILWQKVIEHIVLKMMIVEPDDEFSQREELTTSFGLSRAGWRVAEERLTVFQLTHIIYRSKKLIKDFPKFSMYMPVS